MGYLYSEYIFVLKLKNAFLGGDLTDTSGKAATLPKTAAAHQRAYYSPFRSNDQAVRWVNIKIVFKQLLNVNVKSDVEHNPYDK